MHATLYWNPQHNYSWLCSTTVWIWMVFLRRYSGVWCLWLSLAHLAHLWCWVDKSGWLQNTESVSNHSQGTESWSIRGRLGWEHCKQPVSSLCKWDPTTSESTQGNWRLLQVGANLAKPKRPSILQHTDMARMALIESGTPCQNGWPRSSLFRQH